MKQIQYTLIKIPIKELIRQEYNVTMDRQEEIKNEYLIAQGDSLLFDQIQRLRGSISSHIEELILVVAKKNPKQEAALRHILEHGFFYNGIHYSRFGKSASQAKDGITAFVEVGVGKTLCNLVRKTDKSAAAYAVEDAESLAATLAAMVDRIDALLTRIDKLP